jgi:glutamine amidotransferase
VRRITIVDYGMGNLASVRKALAHLGFDSVLTRLPADIEAAERLILPGVGAFGAAMANLERAALVEPLRSYCASGRPFLGICLGMQLLMSESNEMGTWRGLDIIPGRVRRFFEGGQAPAGIKVPHMGWNTLEIRRRDGLFRSVGESPSVYFVHSYYVVPEDGSVAAATCNHGETFCAALQSGNIFATQFHPEKSGSVGLSILAEFARWQP